MASIKLVTTTDQTNRSEHHRFSQILLISQHFWLPFRWPKFVPLCNISHWSIWVTDVFALSTCREKLCSLIKILTKELKKTHISLMDSKRQEYVVNYKIQPTFSNGKIIGQLKQKNVIISLNEKKVSKWSLFSFSSASKMLPNHFELIIFRFISSEKNEMLTFPLSKWKIIVLNTIHLKSNIIDLKPRFECSFWKFLKWIKYIMLLFSIV